MVNLFVVYIFYLKCMWASAYLERQGNIVIPGCLLEQDTKRAERQRWWKGAFKIQSSSFPFLVKKAEA